MFKFPKQSALLGSALLLAPLSAGSQAPVAITPVVVELFTSEGCSSCPPADLLLGRLATQPNVIALAFHVDYWDGLGWRDRFAIPEATRRQSRYVNTLHLSTAFTPQSIINGRTSLVGSDATRIDAALRPSAGSLSVKLRIEGDDLVAELSRADAAKAGDVNFAAYLSQASTEVGRGENSGRTLKEFNVVRDFKRLGGWDGRPALFRIALASLPPDADRVAVFVQDKTQGAIEAAAALRLR